MSLPREDHDLKSESPTTRGAPPGRPPTQPSAPPGAPEDDPSDEETPKAPPNDDPLGDLDRLRLSQDFAEDAGTTPVITSVPVRKPNRHEFVRVRPGDEWHFDTCVLFADGNKDDAYLVDVGLRPLLAAELVHVSLRVAISRHSPVPFIWPLTLPGPDSRPNRWNTSAAEAAKLAESRWVRVASDNNAKCYVPRVASGDLSEPEWPNLTLDDLLRLAFRDRFIRDVDHPVVQRLLGKKF